MINNDLNKSRKIKIKGNMPILRKRWSFCCNKEKWFANDISTSIHKNGRKLDGLITTMNHKNKNN